ncbi:putative GTP-binding protein EngB [Clostridium acetireducens DSM 10703]|uniref:Probable GTP-binding protein EngB n=1 Tax=Clostridium acetireducens DSM 10703 TaxID=1121290 RepID=A0A1E8EUN9_9CLOT|nr:ribosome biogenesis GTP-binding protein YihA/YsxC [Clostridium acetireducens]OFH97950.1 putative GTP-binding protein EngB [Clostridium acetireducens DSM 10703]
MNIKQADFIISAVNKEQYPKDNKIEIAFVGRSNVGKSSLINTLTNRRKLVKVSGTPGKTRQINFFLINNEFYFVDLPGYGYAKVSKQEKEKWGKIINTYLSNRKQLKKILLLLDCRRKPSEDDLAMYNWIKYYNYDYIIVMTKIDKLKRSEIAKHEKLIRDTLNLSTSEKLIQFSSTKKIGVESLLDSIEESLDKLN